MSAAPSTFLPEIRQIAQAAGDLLMSYFGKVAIEYKGEVDLVTKADRESEQLVVNAIKQRWPGHDVIGEEGTNIRQGGEYKWYVDPLDGTTNFAHGYPVFCVSIALEKKGERIAGVVYDPTRREMFAAEKGSGTELNGRKVEVSKTAQLSECIVATGFPSQKRHKNPNIHFYHQITMKTHGVRRAGSAAMDLAYVACGRFDGYWELNLNPWDTAAGVLLVQEAGGIVTDFWNAPFDIASREVLAGNAAIHPALMAEIQKVMQQRDLEELPNAVEYGKTRRF